MVPLRPPARLVPSLAALLLLAGCSGAGGGYYRVRSGGAFLEQKSGGPLWVACYRDGEIQGAAAARDPDDPLSEWVGSEPAVDHPGIQRWQRQLAELRALSAAADTRGADLVRAAVGFPFDQAVVECCEAWVGGDPQRAGELLDCREDLDVGDDLDRRLAEIAVRGAPGDDRIAKWVGALTREDSDAAVMVLAASDGAGPRTAELLLENLGDYPSRCRRAVFDAAVQRLSAQPDVAYRIVEAAGELPSRDEVAALAALLEAEAPAELARQVLRHLDDCPGSERAALFTLAVECCYRDPSSHVAIVRALSAVPAARRLDGALAVVERPDAAEILVALLADGADVLPSADREALLTEVIGGPHGVAPAVRDACADAARRHLPAGARERVLRRLGREPRPE